MRLLYDDFETFCEPTHMASSLDVVLRRLEERRAKGRNDVALLPLPTGPRDLRRLKPIFRYDAYRKHYGIAADADDYMRRTSQILAVRPHWVDEELAHIAAELQKTPRRVYASRDKGFDPEAPESGDGAAAPVAAEEAR
jgi:hypothetical protein